MSIAKSSVYTTVELNAAIVASLAATGRTNEVCISYAVLGLIDNDGDLTRKEFTDQFLPSLDGLKPGTLKYETARNERNIGGKRFASAQRIFSAHAEFMKKQLARQNDRSMAADHAWIEKYLWKKVNPSAKYSSEGEMNAKNAPDKKGPREEDAVVTSLVNAFVKAVKKHALTQAQAAQLSQAIVAAQMRANEEGRMEQDAEQDAAEGFAPPSEERIAA